MDYEKLMLEVKNKYFPELKDVKVKIKVIGKFGMVFWKIIYGFEPFMLGSKNAIYYNKRKIKKFNKKILSTIFAHELSHALQEKRLNWYKKIISFIKYFFSINYRSKYEKEADRTAIKKGFGKDLISARKLINKIYKKNEVEKRRKVYYSPEDLEKLVYRK